MIDIPGDVTRARCAAQAGGEAIILIEASGDNPGTGLIENFAQSGIGLVEGTGLRGRQLALSHLKVSHLVTAGRRVDAGPAGGGAIDLRGRHSPARLGQPTDVRSQAG
jgi:hypothetical protein